MRPSAIVIGGTTPLGKELREQLEAQGIQSVSKLAVAEGEISAAIGVDEDEAVMLTAVEPDDLRTSHVVFLAGSAEDSVRAYDFISSLGLHPTIIDLSYGLEDRPEARLGAAQLETKPSAALQIAAHPAAIVITAILSRITAKLPVRRAIVHVFEPVSERGQSGMSELQDQTRSLFTFKSLDKAVFDAQASFNMLPRYGSEAPVRLEDIEHRIERHLASLAAAAGVTPLPSLRLVQAPVFHGYSFSFWVEFEQAPTVAALSETLASAQIEVRASDLEPPTNVGSVGQPGITVGVIEPDQNEPKAVWIWAVADNYRISIDNAIYLARAPMEAPGK